ncbi:MAG TPA: rhomboid family intramembrane serine protease [Gaiellaceae bacterium]|nr:rhomboid family intramembrane serine protease [Gaiellaceae bacterium]
MSTLDTARYCYRHPDRETGLSCSECGRPICYECMTPAPVGLRCPEHSGKALGVQKITRPAQRAATTNWRRANAVTMGLIAVNVLVYLAELFEGGSTDGTNNTIFNHGVLFGPYVGQGDWWRVFTAMFLHYGPIHLAMNMYSLYFAGTLLEHIIGRWRFALLYLASGLAGSAGALLWSPTAATVGASGAIFGILGALFVLERKRHIATGGQIAGLIVLNLIFTIGFASFISVGAHFGGLIGGVALMWVMLQFRASWMYSVAGAVALVVASALIAYYKTRGYA